MADDEEQAAPVEDPIKPGAEGEQEPKAEEPTTEEASEPEGGAASEQEGDDEADPRAARREHMAAMGPEERREWFDDAYESMPDEEKDGVRPEAASEKANSEASLRERDVAMKELAESRKNRDDTFQAATDTYLDKLPTAETFDSEGRKVDSFDKKAFTEQRSDAYLQGQITWDGQLRGALGLQLLTVMEENGIKITPEMKKLGTSIGANSMEWLRGTVGEGYAEAKDSAPDSIKAAAKADAEKEAGLIEHRAALTESLSGTGRKKKALAGGGTGGKGWSTKTEARTLHVQDKITNAEMKAINADPTIPEM